MQRAVRTTNGYAEGLRTGLTDASAVGQLVRLASHEIAAVGLVLLVGTGLRLFLLNQQSLWVDEVVTFLSSNGSLLWVITQSEVNSNIPPLYYAVVRGFMTFGVDEVWLRLPSVVFGSASVPLLYAVAREWLGRGTALLGAVLLALSPLHLWYSQEARPYALLVFLSLLAIWLLQRLIRCPARTWERLAFVVVATSMFYCHTIGIAFIAFLAACAVLAAPRQEWGRWAFTFAGIGVLLVPAVLRLMSLPPIASADSERRFTVVDMAYTLWALGSGYSLGPTLTELHQPDRIGTVLRWLPVVFPVSLILGLLGVLGSLGLWRRGGRERWMVALWLTLPIAFAIVGSLLTVHPYNVRYAILAYPAFVLVLGLGTQQINLRWLRWTAVLALVAIACLAVGDYFFNPRYYREDNRAAGQLLAAAAVPGDLVVANAPYTTSALQHYVPRNDLVIVGYPGRNSLAQGGAESTLALSRKVELDMASLIGSRTRFWLFLSRTYHGGDVEPDLLRLADRQFRPAEDLVTDNDVRLILYQKRDS